MLTFLDASQFRSSASLQFLERSLSPICIYDSCGQPRYASSSLLALLKTTLEEVAFFDYFPSELTSRIALTSFWKRALRGEPVEFLAKTREASEEVNCTLQFDPEANIVFLSAEKSESEFDRLTQEYERAIAALLKTEEKWKGLVLNSPCLFIQTSNAGQILYTSPAAERLLGYKQEELQGRHVLEFLASNHSDEFEDVLQIWSHDAESTMLGVKWWWKKKSGRWVYLYLQGQRFPSALDMNGVVISGYNISDRKFLERKLRRYKAINQTMLQMLPDLTRSQPPLENSHYHHQRYSNLI
jgi:PAS domain S-box-containing protein